MSSQGKTPSLSKGAAWGVAVGVLILFASRYLGWPPARTQRQSPPSPIAVKNIEEWVASEEGQRHIRERSLAQATAADNLTVAILRAFEFHGKSYHDLKVTPFRIAVDVEFQGDAHGFDFDDIDLMDEHTHKFIGGAPDVARLEKSEPATTERAKPKSRFRLVFRVPALCEMISLHYWGKKLAPLPHAVETVEKDSEQVELTE